MLYLYGITGTYEDGFCELQALWGLFSEDPNVYMFGHMSDQASMLENVNSAMAQESERLQQQGGLKLAGWYMSSMIWPSLVSLSLRGNRVVAPSMRHPLDRKYNDSWMFLDVERIYTQGFDRDGYMPCLASALNYWLREDPPLMSEGKLGDAWFKAEKQVTDEIGMTVAGYLRGMKQVVELYYSEPANA